jgi:Pretoxin HINT domain
VGWRAVETIEPGEEVLSRTEFDPLTTPEWKRVEARFERTGCILHLYAGGEVIRTTPEHPFYVEGSGWTAAGSLKPGDRIATLSGAWVTVEEVFDTELYEPVYNLRVEEHHTYFVGDENWEWAAWAHNAYSQFQSELAQPGMVPGKDPSNANGRQEIQKLGGQVWNDSNLKDHTDANTDWSTANRSSQTLIGKLKNAKPSVANNRNVALLTLAASTKSTQMVPANDQWAIGSPFFRKADADVGRLRAQGFPRDKVVAVA